MSVLKFRKVNSLPEILEANTIYIIKSGTNHVLHITDNTGTIAYKSFDSVEIAAVSSAYISGLIGQPNGLAELDGSGNIIGDIAGNAATATSLETARNINGVAFDGTQDIIITSSLLFKEVTLNFGSIPTNSKSFTITDVGAVTTNKILISASGNPAAGRSSDELEMDNFICSAVCLNNGQITIYANAVPGPVTGQYNFNYTLG